MAERSVIEAASIGRKVLRALEAGRAKAILQAKRRAAQNAESVRVLADLDKGSGKPARGRAGRIARKLHGAISESQVRRILRMLSSVRDSQEQTDCVDDTGGIRAKRAA